MVNLSQPFSERRSFLFRVLLSILVVFCIAKLLKEDKIWTKKHLKLGGHSCAEREVSSLEKKLLLDNTIQDITYL